MVRPARLFVLALAWLCLASTAFAGPILSTGPYVVNMPSGGKYEVSAEVSLGGAGYIYTYSVTNLTQKQRYFELGIAESVDMIGLYSETNAQVVNGPGLLLRDRTPFKSNAADPHNYVFTNLVNHHRIGIQVLPGETQLLSFEDKYKPTMSDWTLRERNPFVQHRHNTQLSLGQLPVPTSAPEPATLTLAALGIVGLGLGAARKRRQKSEA